jgi:hypothetical protein
MTMGCNQVAWQITTFANSAGHQLSIIKSYNQINVATFKSECVRFCKPGEANSQTCDLCEAEQYNDEHLPSKVANG